MTAFRKNFRKARRVFGAIVGMDVYTRVQVHCPTLYLGNENASWCVCPTGLSDRSIVYSFGVGTDISFELALIQKFGMGVHAFDPTPRSAAWIKTQTTPEEFLFHEYGLNSQDGTAVFHSPRNPDFVSFTVVARNSAGDETVEAPVRRLKTIMGLLGHERVDVLKMDIEGAEYGVIADLIKSGANVRQLLIEFHHRWPEIGSLRTKEAIRDLNGAGFRIFDVSAAGSEYGFLMTRRA